jgi:hypothetical protein
MARTTENNEAFVDAVDQLGRILSGVLRTAFVASAAPQRAKAAHILEQFDNAARKAHTVTKRVSHRNAFNINASRTPERQRLLSRLPTAEQSSDLRKYFAAKATLLEASPNIGGQIIRHAMGQEVRIAATKQYRLPLAPSA